MLSLVVLLAAACSAPGPLPPAPAEEAVPDEIPTEITDTVAAPDEAFAPESGAPLPVPGDPTWPEAVLANLSLEEKVGQMLMPWTLGDFAPEGSASHNRIVGMIERQKVGGVIISVGTPTEVAVKLNHLQEHSEIPLLVGADLETGAGFRMRGAVFLPNNIELGGATTFPSLMAVGATENPEFAYQMGRVTALEARAVGIHLPFGPVLDVNNNPSNPIISIRSFGEEPDAVADLGIQFVRGLQENGTIATGKHFPGHGDTETDSHVDLPVVRVDRDRLEAIELKPFRRAIEAGMAGIMTGHVSIPVLTGSTSTPSTLSPAVLTELLRDDMGFDGLIVTDAMDMYAIDRRFKRGEAAVRAIEAGADILLMPPSPAEAVQGVAAAVRSGRLPESRIDESVLRILRIKQQMELDTKRFTDIAAIPRIVGIPEHEDVARRIAEESITLLRNEGDLLPLRGTRTANVLSVSYRAQNNLLAGKYFDQRLRETYPRLRSQAVTRGSTAQEYRDLLARARQSHLVVVSVYVSAARSNGEATLPEELRDFVGQLARARIPHVVVSFGNPYLLSELREVRAYMLAWSGAEVSQRAAAGALLGDIEIRGRTPTRLPPFFEIGDGIQVPRKGARSEG